MVENFHENYKASPINATYPEPEDGSASRDDRGSSGWRGDAPAQQFSSSTTPDVCIISTERKLWTDVSKEMRWQLKIDGQAANVTVRVRPEGCGITIERADMPLDNLQFRDDLELKTVKFTLQEGISCLVGLDVQRDSLTLKISHNDSELMPAEEPSQNEKASVKHLYRGRPRLRRETSKFSTLLADSRGSPKSAPESKTQKVQDGSSVKSDTKNGELNNQKADPIQREKLAMRLKSIEMFKEYTQPTEQSEQIRAQNEQFYERLEALKNWQVFTPLDAENKSINLFAFFSAEFNSLLLTDQCEQVKQTLTGALRFLAQLGHPWQIICFYQRTYISSPATQYLDEEILREYRDEEGQPFYKGHVQLYNLPYLFRSAATHAFPDLHSFLSQACVKSDSLLAQSLITAMPKAYQLSYFKERRESAKTHHEAVEAPIGGVNPVASGQLKVSNFVIGRLIGELPRRPESSDSNEAPLIFWLLAGFFRQNSCRQLRKQGIFRVNSSAREYQAIETEISRGNYAYLNQLDNAFLVANFWKKILYTMREPLIPFQQFEEYKKLAYVTPDKRLVRMKQLIQDLHPCNFNALKLFIQFLTEVVSFSEENKMTAYNVSVTVAHCIFRPRVQTEDEALKVRIHYDVTIRMIENFDWLFCDAKGPVAQSKEKVGARLDYVGADQTGPHGI